MRIITGSAKGTKLKTPRDSDLIRPTADRVKESVFNVLGPRVLGAKVLDLFAGTGNLGLEALSRGAKNAIFVDRSNLSVGLIRENAARTKLTDRVTIYRGDVLRILDKLAGSGDSFDLIFCDPPYNKGLVAAVLAKVDQTALLAVDGIMIVEHSHQEAVKDEWDRLSLSRTLRYGDTLVSIFTTKQHKQQEG